MFDLSTVTSDTPLTFVALAVIYNLVRHGLNLHHQRKQEASDEATHERIVALSRQLAAALEETKYLKKEVDTLRSRTAEKVQEVKQEISDLKEKGA